MPPKSKPERTADEILETLGVAEPPIPIHKVVRHLGLQLQHTELGDDVSGVLVVRGGHGLIGVNITDSRVRQRFSIAHECGHYVLHRRSAKLFIDKTYLAFRDGRSSTGQYRQERDANAFAAALLMPESMLRSVLEAKQYDVEDENDLDEFARTFEVSRQALTYRIANLGLLS